MLLASGPAAADATDFELTATLGSEVYGILSNPFLYESFRTRSYRIHVTVHDDRTWSYEEEGVLQIPDRDEPFSHIDRNTLTRVAPPTLNPLATEAAAWPPSDAAASVSAPYAPRGGDQGPLAEERHSRAIKARSSTAPNRRRKLDGPLGSSVTTAALGVKGRVGLQVSLRRPWPRARC